MPKTNDNFLTREEIIDGKVRICGYRYGYLNPHAPAQDYISALRQAKVKELAERRLPVIRINPIQWRQADFGPIIGPNTMFQFSIDSAEEIDTELLQTIRGHNVGIVLADSKQVPPSSSIFQYASAVMIDFNTYSPGDFASRLEDYKNHWGELEIAVENLPDWGDQRHCLSLGARYSLGSFVFK